MAKELNLIPLLKNEIGTELWSPAINKVTLTSINEETDSPFFTATSSQDGEWCFYKDGKISSLGGLMLFPSEHVQDWGMFKPTYVHPRNGNDSVLLELLKDAGGDMPMPNVFTESSEEHIYYIDRLDGEIKALYRKDTTAEVWNYIEDYGHKLDIEVVKNGISKAHLIIEEEAGFSPFEQVVVRKAKGIWKPRAFDHPIMLGGGVFQYLCQDGVEYDECLPYTEDTHQLLGTTADVEILNKDK